MRQTNQDTPAGRIQPSQYDTELPSDARTELLRPRRPGILTPATFPADRAASSRFCAILAASSAWLALGSGWSCGVVHSHRFELAKSGKTHSCFATVGSSESRSGSKGGRGTQGSKNFESGACGPADPDASAAGQPAARTATASRINTRARLVRLPTPPLRLIELTPEHIDESHRITMPYGTEVLATLRGFLGPRTSYRALGGLAICTSSVLCLGFGSVSLALARQRGLIREENLICRAGIIESCATNTKPARQATKSTRSIMTIGQTMELGGKR